MSVQGEKPLRILILLNRIPYPLNDGGAIGAYNFLKGYSEAGCKLTVLAMNTAKHFVKDTIAYRELGRFGTLRMVNVDNRINPFRALINLFTGGSYIIERFISANFQKQFKRIMTENSFDIIHIDGLPPAAYIDNIKGYSRAKVSMRAHNVEHVIWQRIAEKETNFLKKWYVKIQADRLREFELRAIAKCNLVLAISKEDEDTIKALVPDAVTAVVPACMDVADEVENNNYSAGDLCFIGSFDWMPNQQGMQWFLDECWGKINAAHPEVKLTIAGKKMPNSFAKMRLPNVVPVGEVRNAKEFMLNHGIMVVPIVSGSGIRIKILEGMALGKCVIATTIAAEGLNLTNGENVLIADSPEQFIAQIGKCLNDENFSRTIGRKAHKFAYDNYRNQSIFEKLVSVYRSL